MVHALETILLALALSEEVQSTTRIPTSHVAGEEVAEPLCCGRSGSVNLLISSEQRQKANGGTYLASEVHGVIQHHVVRVAKL